MSAGKRGTRKAGELEALLINTLERVYPGWHVWISDEGIWYATWRGTSPDWPNGGEAWTPRWLIDDLRQPCTVWARDSAALSNELAAEDSARMRRMLATQNAGGMFTRETLNGCIHRKDTDERPKVDRATARRNGLL